MPTLQEVKFFLNQFKQGDINDEKYRQALIDTFVNKIYLYDEKMTILYNTQDGHSHMNLDELGSSKVALVEMAGVEPASESTLTGTSPGADGYLYSLASAGAVTLESSVASLFMVRSKLCARTCTTCRRSVPGRGPPGGNAR